MIIMQMFLRMHGTCYTECMILQTTNIRDLVVRLRKRAEIRRGIPTRKSVQEGLPDRIADLLEEAADRIEYLERVLNANSI